MSHLDEQILGAYFDGELPADERAIIDSHLRTCPQCSAELQRLGEFSRILQEHEFQDITERELRDLHRAVEDAADVRVWRIGSSLGVIAASVLIIGIGWLSVLPNQTSQPGSEMTIAARPAPATPWERMAMTLTPGPPIVDQPLIDVALADWMLEGLPPGQSPQGVQR
jgi:anti-sigma factor RsiW